MDGELEQRRGNADHYILPVEFSQIDQYARVANTSGFPMPLVKFMAVLQRRTGHGFIGEYYALLFALTEPTVCSCGQPRQTQEHILRDSPLFTYQHICCEKYPVTHTQRGPGYGEGALAK